MSVVPEQFRLEFMPSAAREAMVHIGNARFTVLTERLIRLEYHPEGCFEDRASQAFWYRQQPIPLFDAQTTASGIEIETAYLHLKFEPQGDEGFTAANLSIRLKTSDTIWYPGMVDEHNLRGTTRTLDYANGYVKLETGLMSRSGWSVLDDSVSLIFNEECWLEPRTLGGTDLYFFGYGHDYKACLRDYCEVSGKIPVIPRWALGNWWSRYWHYSQQELTTLIEDFDAYQLPFSVCIIDMDWHITRTNNTSTGWTGYTWNRDLFPDPQGFMDFAHDHNLKISMNLHPAEGIHDHEEQYEAMALALGIDPTTRQPVPFDIANPAFAKAYFEILHHPYEKMGVDFWWIDWQQGQKSTIEGLDPLWLINHLHFHDLNREGGRRPFIFSRWGNEGHQRYPIGFSGDSYITWDSLNFQSYMTATATNIAYGWWSHDIGGHTSGVEDPELFTRWVQFGVLSPINRLHVTKGFLYDRRPWAFEDAEVLKVLQEALQFRHALVPYLYTMARRAHDESMPLIQPMYYEYPDEEAAYHCPHQYLFGTDLIAAPFVSPADPQTGLSRQVVWLPKGDWYHFFTGEHYTGNRWQVIYGRLADMPLFARAGAIIPLSSDPRAAQNPAELELHLFAGADGSFTLYEDDGETSHYLDNRFCQTTITQKWQEKTLTLTIAAAAGDTSLIPAQRSYQLHVYGICEDVTIDTGSSEITHRYNPSTETLIISGLQGDSASTLTLTIQTEASSLLARRNRQRETIIRLLKFFKLHTGVRNRIAEELDTILADPAKLAPYILTMANSQARALFEVLYEAGMHHIHDTHESNLIVMWNNQENDCVTFRYGDVYLFFGSIRDMNHDEGVIPRFAHFVPPVNSWSHGAEREHVHRTQWSAQIDYCNLLTVNEHHREVTP